MRNLVSDEALAKERKFPLTRRIALCISQARILKHLLYIIQLSQMKEEILTKKRK